MPGALRWLLSVLEESHSHHKRTANSRKRSVIVLGIEEANFIYQIYQTSFGKGNPLKSASVNGLLGSRPISSRSA